MSSLPVTRGSLIARVATRANTSGYADATTVGGEVSGLVDTSLAKMHNLLVGLYEDFFTKTNSIVLVGGQDTYALPPDFFKLRAPFYMDTSGFRWPMRRVNISDLTTLPQTLNQTSTVPFGYALVNNSITIFSCPTGTQTAQVLLFYIPTYTPPANDATPIEYQVAFGWDEWVVNDVCVQIRNKAMMPAQEIMQERDKMEAAIRHQAKQRNAGEAPRVRDNGWGDGGSFKGRGSFSFQ